MSEGSEYRGGLLGAWGVDKASFGEAAPIMEPIADVMLGLVLACFLGGFCWGCVRLLTSFMSRRGYFNLDEDRAARLRAAQREAESEAERRERELGEQFSNQKPMHRHSSDFFHTWRCRGSQHMPPSSLSSFNSPRSCAARMRANLDSADAASLAAVDAAEAELRRAAQAAALARYERAEKALAFSRREAAQRAAAYRSAMDEILKLPDLEELENGHPVTHTSIKPSIPAFTKVVEGGRNAAGRYEPGKVSVPKSPPVSARGAGEGSQTGELGWGSNLYLLPTHYHDDNASTQVGAAAAGCAVQPQQIAST